MNYAAHTKWILKKSLTVSMDVKMPEEYKRISEILEITF